MPTCFVIQRINSKFDKRYRDVYKPALEKAGLDPYQVVVKVPGSGDRHNRSRVLHSRAWRRGRAATERGKRRCGRWPRLAQLPRRVRFRRVAGSGRNPRRGLSWCQ